MYIRNAPFRDTDKVAIAKPNCTGWNEGFKHAGKLIPLMDSNGSILMKMSYQELAYGPLVNRI